MELPETIRKYIEKEVFVPENIGMSGSKVYLSENAVLKIGELNDNTASEINMMNWLKGKLPVPEIICHEVKDGKSYLLMSRIKGEMACEKELISRPEELAKILAEGLNALWDVDISGCPIEVSLESELAQARKNIAENRVDIQNTEPETFGKGGFKDPAALLEWLESNKPDCRKVLSHGDFCLPNIFVSGGKISGYIDLGGAGTADKWRDISLCYRSFKHNLAYYSMPEEKAELLFDALGIVPDRERLRYWILLDELF